MNRPEEYVNQEITPISTLTVNSTCLEVHRDGEEPQAVGICLI